MGNSHCDTAYLPQRLSSITKTRALNVICIDDGRCCLCSASNPRDWPSQCMPKQPTASTHNFPFEGFIQKCKCSPQLLTFEWEEKTLNFLALLWWNDPEVCSLLLSIVPQWYQQPPPPPSIDRANPLNNIFLGHPKINYLLTGVG